ncbi:hypothetical protein [Flavobacterium alkalisoli]|uniref:hypothetical protein n=1 Tax=Flavobacterium alkalisoli TaxID=2602769 RepID=UPI003A8DAB8D
MKYSNNLSLLDDLSLDGFFVGWPNPPSNEVLKKLLHGSYKVVIAHDGEKLGMMKAQGVCLRNYDRQSGE